MILTVFTKLNTAIKYDSFIVLASTKYGGKEVFSEEEGVYHKNSYLLTIIL